MEFYRLAGLNDIPELVVHMMTGKGYDERGVIGLGEPPVVSPGRRDLERGGERDRRPRSVPSAHSRASTGRAERRRKEVRNASH